MSPYFLVTIEMLANFIFQNNHHLVPLIFSIVQYVVVLLWLFSFISFYWSGTVFSQVLQGMLRLLEIVFFTVGIYSYENFCCILLVLAWLNQIFICFKALFGFSLESLVIKAFKNIFIYLWIFSFCCLGPYPALHSGVPHNKLRFYLNIKN